MESREGAGNSGWAAVWWQFVESMEGAGDSGYDAGKIFWFVSQL